MTLFTGKWATFLYARPNPTGPRAAAALCNQSTMVRSSSDRRGRVAALSLWLLELSAPRRPFPRRAPQPSMTSRAGRRSARRTAQWPRPAPSSPSRVPGEVATRVGHAVARLIEPGTRRGDLGPRHGDHVVVGTRSVGEWRARGRGGTRGPWGCGCGATSGAAVTARARCAA